MGYGIEEWKGRIAQRSDFTTGLVHLTRAAADRKALDVLFKILCDKRLKGSTTASGFIVGDTPATCFQEAPLYSLTQNIHTEQVFRAKNKKAKIRYLGFGLQFSKFSVFAEGGRPVIYDKTQSAKAYLPPNQWWRIVGFDLEDDNNIIDWCHEREWRVPGDYEFEFEDVTVLLPNHKIYGEFINKCMKEGREDILKEISGIVVLASVFF